MPHSVFKFATLAALLSLALSIPLPARTTFESDIFGLENPWDLGEGESIELSGANGPTSTNFWTCSPSSGCEWAYDCSPEISTNLKSFEDIISTSPKASNLATGAEARWLDGRFRICGWGDNEEKLLKI